MPRSLVIHFSFEAMNYEEALMMGGQGCAGQGVVVEQADEVWGCGGCGGGSSAGSRTEIFLSFPSLLRNLSVSQEHFLALGDISSI